MITAICATICLGEENDAFVQIRSRDIAEEREAADLMALAPRGEEEKWIEVFFAANYALRQLSNLGPSSALTSRLVGGLRTLSYQEKDGEACVGHSEVTLSTNVTSKQIELELEFGAGGASQLVVNHTGFGFFGRKAPQYAPGSVFALFQALSKRRSDDIPYVRRLLLAAMECARQVHQLNLTNHARLSLLIATGCWAASVEGEYHEDHKTP